MEITAAWWVTWVLGFIPLMILILQWWNELRYVLPLKRVLASKNLKLPPGSMGFPFIGELLTFLWYFKIVRRPDDFINSKRAKYGDGVGMYRTYLFGSPSIIAYSPAVTQFVFRSDNLFPYRFPTNDLVGANSMLAATGEHHARVKSYVIAALAHTDSLKKIVLHVQPGIKASLHSWAEKGIVTTFGVVKKMVFENIAQIFVGIEPGPLLDDIGRYYAGLVKGFRAQPFNIPGTTYYHAIQCRKKLMKIFKLELEKRKENKKLDGENKDLMDMLKQIKDEEGKKLSDEEVLDNIVSLFLGGFDSTASVSAWAIYYLAKNPDVLQILREENMQLGAVEGELVTFDQVSQMKYTKKVVEETIRMSNVSLIAFRSGDYDVEYEGYLLPKGWKVLQWIRYSHTNSEYFENPSYFNPDRWNQSTKPEAYQAFGGGSMKCVGTELVHTQLAVFLHHLVLGYKYGDGAGLYRTYLFGFPSILACTPAATKFVFHSHLLFPHRFSTKELVGPNSMLAATGDYHARIKSHVTAGLVHTNSLKKFLLVAQPGMKASLESWAQMGTIRSFDVVKKMVFENIAEFFVSIKPGPLLDELLGYYIDMFKGFKARPLKIPGTTYYHALQCRKKVREIFKIELEKRKRDRKDGEYKDLIDALWQIKDGEGNVLSDEEVLDNISSLILGGYESSSGVAAWAMIYLANNPDVLQKLREENMEISKTLSEGELLTLDHVSKMVYTKKVFEESARLANTTGFLFRAGDQDVEYKGYLIPKGWKVIQWIRYAHESSEYFEDAMTFNPDRWDQYATKPDAYQAFGTGKMSCPGPKLAQTQIAVFLHHLVVGYKWEIINPDEKIIYTSQPVLNGGGKIAITAI